MGWKRIKDGEVCTCVFPSKRQAPGMSANDHMNSRTASASLRLLATSDVHMHMTGWDARQDKTACGIGLDQLAITIHEARATAPGHTLLLDNGDILQGTAEGDICARPNCAIPHPWPAVANALGYDAVGLGNHDFDYGIEFLEGIVAQIAAPVLCASLSEGHIEGVQSGVLLSLALDCQDGLARPISIGVFSVLPPQTLMWNHRNLVGQVAFDNGVDAATRAVKKLRADGADLIVALCHSGLSAQTDPGTENFAAQLAKDVPGIDAMIMGHTHRRFPGEDHGIGAVADAKKATIANVPAVMPEFAAQSLGVIDLDLVWDEGCWRVVGHSVALKPAAQCEADTAISTLAAPSIAATRTLMDVPVSATGHGIHSYFNALQTETEHALVARAMTRVIADEARDTPFASLPVLASVSSSAVGGHGGVANFIAIPKGTVLARHVAMICPYQNDIWAAVLTGADLWNWAERSAAYFGPRVGTVSHLANPDAPFFSFDSLMGLETVIDPFAPPRYDPTGGLIDSGANRIRSLKHNGIDLAPDSKFLVAMTSYRGAGGGAFPGLTTAETILRTDADLAKAVQKELIEEPLGDAPAPSAWHFASNLSQQVMLETSPDAADHLDSIARFDPHPMGLTDAGFLQIRVTL